MFKFFRVSLTLAFAVMFVVACAQDKNKKDNLTRIKTGSGKKAKAARSDGSALVNTTPTDAPAQDMDAKDEAADALDNYNKTKCRLMVDTTSAPTGTDKLELCGAVSVHVLEDGVIDTSKLPAKLHDIDKLSDNSVFNFAEHVDAFTQEFPTPEGLVKVQTRKQFTADYAATNNQAPLQTGYRLAHKLSEIDVASIVVYIDEVKLEDTKFAIHKNEDGDVATLQMVDLSFTKKIDYALWIEYNLKTTSAPAAATEDSTERVFTPVEEAINE